MEHRVKTSYVILKRKSNRSFSFAAENSHSNKFQEFFFFLIQEVPSGDWFCDRCKPKEKPKSPRKNRQIYKDVSDDEEEFDKDCDEEEERFVIVLSNVTNYYHFIQLVRHAVELNDLIWDHTSIKFTNCALAIRIALPTLSSFVLYLRFSEFYFKKVIETEVS